MSIEPENSVERKKLGDTLEMLKRQDPTLRVESSDEGLRARLEIEGVVSLAEQMGVTSDDPDPPVRYACSSQSLTIQCVLGNTWVPSEGEFIEMLDCLVHLARINNRVNSPLA